MKMKHLFYLLLFSLCSSKVSAQDVIVKKDGSTIISKVLEVNIADVKYKKFSNINGPTYTIGKADIMSINYENGEKDDFNEVTRPNNTQQSAQGMINKQADANNEIIIQRHNIIYPNFDGKAHSNKACTLCTIKYGIKSSSIMSNEDIEIEFVRKNVMYYKTYEELFYYINIRNKTDRFLYIDKGNCFRIYNDGYSYCYYDASKQTTVNNGASNGGSLNIGSLAGALGIGGAIGQIAGGVNVGGSSSGSVSTTYASQRFIAIPPHGNKPLTEYICVGEGNNRKCIESPEYFNYIIFWFDGIEDHEYKSTVDIGLKRGIVNYRDTKVFAEDELPWKREYFITYSLDADFSSYSTLHAELYIQEIIGDQPESYVKLHQKGKWFQNDNTIVNTIHLDKK